MWFHASKCRANYVLVLMLFVFVVVVGGGGGVGGCVASLV